MTQHRDWYVNSEYFQELIDNYLKTHQMNAKDLANKVGISTSTLSRLQQGSGRFRRDILKKIVTVLEVKPEKLISSRDPHEKLFPPSEFFRSRSDIKEE